jgi:hypothetical protein
MLHINELSNDQRRHLIDMQQIFEAYEVKDRLAKARYAGSMRWAERNGTEYLLRKRGKVEHSLGRRSPETELIHRQFIEGRERNESEMKSLVATMEQRAPVNRAMGLGRVPKLTARILRRLADARLLGTHLHVVGTNALFAYEARSGAFFSTGLLATGDADLLMDARRKLRLTVDEVRREGVLGVIRKVDKSFQLRGKRDFRAFNKDGFYVDLIRPETGNVMSPNERDRIGQSEDDLRGSPIHGLNWLVNAPKFSAIALDEGGYPVRIEAVDPRAFALHKAWVSSLPEREPLKRNRDYDQAIAVARVAERCLNLPFDSEDLSALPIELRQQAARLLKGGISEPESDEDAGEQPSWW